jgi:hypothetical protein
MPEDTNTGAMAEADAPHAPQAQPNTSDDIVKTLREEAKARRLENKALKAELEDLRGKVAQTPSAEAVTKLEQLLESERQEREALKREAADAKRTELKLTIGAEFGLSPALAKRLVGETEDELRADAEALKPHVATPPTGPQRPGSSTTPVPGGQPQGETDEQKRSRLLRGNKAGTFWGSKS